MKVLVPPLQGGEVNQTNKLGERERRQKILRYKKKAKDMGAT